MKIIFVKAHILNDQYGVKVYPGQTGVLFDDSIGLIDLDNNSVKNQIAFGTIDGVQPSFYIPVREDAVSESEAEIIANY